MVHSPCSEMIDRRLGNVGTSSHAHLHTRIARHTLEEAGAQGKVDVVRYLCELPQDHREAGA